MGRAGIKPQDAFSAGSDRVLDRTIQSEPRLENAQTFFESAMALFSECTQRCVRRYRLTPADILRDRDLTTVGAEQPLARGAMGIATPATALADGIEKPSQDFCLRL